MRILLIKLGFIHQKNLDGFKAMFQDVVIQTTFKASTEPWDLVWIPYGLVDPKALPGAKRIILGPHNFVFPTQEWNRAFNDPRVSYNCLSDWNRMAVGDLKLECLPFPVDTDSFAPSDREKTHDCLLYTKSRRPEEIEYAVNALKEQGLTYRRIDYGSYTEADYKEVLASCRFGLWVGRHESQGFALQEALSSGVPLLIWNVETMGEEWNGQQSYTGKEGAYEATSIPYWDMRCGVVVRKDNLKEGLRFMRGSWATYRPREFVIERLSAEACAKLWLEN